MADNNRKERQLNKVVDREFVQKLLRTGHDFDLNKGGLFDARSGCVNFWCSPEDKPACWDAEVDAGALDFPRAYVGAMYWQPLDEDGKRWKLRLEATPYDLLDSRPLVNRRQHLPEHEWNQVLDWVQAKAHDLLRLAGLQPKVVGTKCPFCDYVLPAGELLNGLLDHVALGHPEVQSSGLHVGEKTGLLTPAGLYEFKPVEVFED